MLLAPLAVPAPLVYERAVCWDFDKSLVYGHWHNILKEAGVIPGDSAKYIDALMNGNTIGEQESKSLLPPGLRNPKEISRSMKRTLEKGVALAIVSFSHYPEIIKAALLQLTAYAEVGGLTPADIDKIYIRSGFPSDNNPEKSPMGKKEHLLDVMAHFSITKKENILLVDDTIRNCLICRGISPGDCPAIDPAAVGFQAVEVPAYPDPSLDYIHQVNRFVAPITQDELDEVDFLNTLGFVTSKLKKLNFTMSRMHMDSDEDPVKKIVKDLKSIKGLTLSFAQRKARISESLQQYKQSPNTSRDIIRMIEKVELELNDKPK